jgi:pimeloyl-ACP methyl ester carboxylesterase
LEKVIKWIKRILGVVVGIHLIIFLILVFQDNLIFRSTKVSPDYKLKILIPHAEYVWSDSNSSPPVILHNTIYKARDKSAGKVFYLHGSAKNAEYHTHYVAYFTQLGYDVWMMDYRGFGKSRGKRTEKNLQEDALRMYDAYLKYFNIDSSQAIIIGRSLGAALAAHVAAQRQPAKLGLVAPFKDLPDMLKSYIPWFPFRLFTTYQFNIDDALPAYKGKIAIFYGKNDLLVPSRSARKLIPLLKPGDEYHEYEFGSHKSVTDNADYQADMEFFLKN